MSWFCRCRWVRPARQSPYLGEVEIKLLNPAATGEAGEPTEGQVLKLRATSSTGVRG